MNFAAQAEAEVAALLRDIDNCIDSHATSYRRSPVQNKSASLAGVLSAAAHAAEMVQGYKENTANQSSNDFQSTYLSYLMDEHEAEADNPFSSPPVAIDASAIQTANSAESICAQRKRSPPRPAARPGETLRINAVRNHVDRIRSASQRSSAPKQHRNTPTKRTNTPSKRANTPQRLDPQRLDPQHLDPEHLDLQHLNPQRLDPQRLEQHIEADEWHQEVEEGTPPKWWERLAESPERIRKTEAKEKQLTVTVRKEKRRLDRESSVEFLTAVEIQAAQEKARARVRTPHKTANGSGATSLTSSRRGQGQLRVAWAEEQQWAEQEDALRVLARTHHGSRSSSSSSRNGGSGRCRGSISSGSDDRHSTQYQSALRTIDLDREYLYQQQQQQYQQQQYQQQQYQQQQYQQQYQHQEYRHDYSYISEAAAPANINEETFQSIALRNNSLQQSILAIGSTSSGCANAFGTTSTAFGAQTLPHQMSSMLGSDSCAGGSSSMSYQSEKPRERPRSPFESRAQIDSQIPEIRSRIRHGVQHERHTDVPSLAGGDSDMSLQKVLMLADEGKMAAEAIGSRNWHTSTQYHHQQHQEHQHQYQQYQRQHRQHHQQQQWQYQQLQQDLDQQLLVQRKQGHQRLDTMDIFREGDEAEVDQALAQRQQQRQQLQQQQLQQQSQRRRQPQKSSPTTTTYHYELSSLRKASQHNSSTRQQPPQPPHHQQQQQLQLQHQPSYLSPALPEAPPDQTEYSPLYDPHNIASSTASQANPRAHTQALAETRRRTPSLAQNSVVETVSVWPSDVKAEKENSHRINTYKDVNGDGRYTSTQRTQRRLDWLDKAGNNADSVDKIRQQRGLATTTEKATKPHIKNPNMGAEVGAGYEGGAGLTLLSVVESEAKTNELYQSIMKNMQRINRSCGVIDSPTF